MTLVIVAQVVFLVGAAAYLIDTWRHRHEVLDLPDPRRPRADRPVEAERCLDLLVRWDDSRFVHRCTRAPYRSTRLSRRRATVERLPSRRD